MATSIKDKIMSIISEGQPPRMDMETYYSLMGAVNDISMALTAKGEDGRAFLGNAFSLQMVPGDAIIGVTEIEPEEVPEDAMSVVGHPDTANVVSGILGRQVPCNRASIRLEQGDVLYVAQLTGGRLPEGATALPEGFTLKWLKVVVR